jgi:outer membrane lipoprotein SlyB
MTNKMLTISALALASLAPELAPAGLIGADVHPAIYNVQRGQEAVSTPAVTYRRRVRRRHTKRNSAVRIGGGAAGGAAIGGLAGGKKGAGIGAVAGAGAGALYDQHEKHKGR